MLEDTGSPFQKYVDDGSLDVAAIESLESIHIDNLNSAVLRSLFEANKLTFEEVRNMHVHERMEREAVVARTQIPEGIQALIRKQLLTEEDARSLTLDQRNILLGVDPIDVSDDAAADSDYDYKRDCEQRAAVKAQFLAGKLHAKLISYPNAQKYIDDRSLSPENIDTLTPSQKLYLNNGTLRELFEARCVTFQELLDLTGGQWQKLKNPQVVAKVKQGELLVKLLERPVLQAYVDASEVKPGELDGLLKPQDDAAKNRSANLNSETLFSLYQGKKLTFAQVSALTAGQRVVFEKTPEARDLFREGKLLLELVEYYNVRKYVDAKIQHKVGGELVTLEDIAKLSLTQRVMLNSPVVCELVVGGHLKYAQVLSLSPQQGVDLANNKDNVADKIKAGTMLVVPNVGFVSVGNAAPKAVMHGGASGHSASAAAAVSSSQQSRFGGGSK